MLWENLREEFEGAIEESRGVCIIPIGCVEAHGQHLPLGCDVMYAREYARRAAEVEPVCFSAHLLTPFYWMANYPNSYDGEMHYGLNERIARAMGESNTECIAEMYKFIKNETISTEYHAKWIKRNFK